MKPPSPKMAPTTTVDDLVAELSTCMSSSFDMTDLLNALLGPNKPKIPKRQTGSMPMPIPTSIPAPAPAPLPPPPSTPEPQLFGIPVSKLPLEDQEGYAKYGLNWVPASESSSGEGHEWGTLPPAYWPELRTREEIEEEEERDYYSHGQWDVILKMKAAKAKVETLRARAYRAFSELQHHKCNLDQLAKQLGKTLKEADEKNQVARNVINPMSAEILRGQFMSMKRMVGHQKWIAAVTPWIVDINTRLEAFVQARREVIDHHDTRIQDVKEEFLRAGGAAAPDDLHLLVFRLQNVSFDIDEEVQLPKTSRIIMPLVGHDDDHRYWEPQSEPLADSVMEICESVVEICKEIYDTAQYFRLFNS